MPSLKHELARRQGFFSFLVFTGQKPFLRFGFQEQFLCLFFPPVCNFLRYFPAELNCFCFKLYKHWLTVTLLMHCNFVFLN